MMINKENYDLYAIDFIDGNLDTRTRSEMAAFLDKNPDIKNEMDELSNPITLEADTSISYDNKASLKKEEKKKVLWITQIQNYAAAAIILLAAGMIWMNISDNTSNQENNIATIEIEQEKPITNNVPQSDTTTPEISNPIINKEPNKKEIAITQSTSPQPQNQIITIKDNTPETPNEINRINKPVPYFPLVRINKELIVSNDKEEIETEQINTPAKTANLELITSVDFILESQHSMNNTTIPLNLMAAVNDDTKSSIKKGQWLLNAITKRSDGTKIFAFEGIKRALTPTRLRDAKVDRASPNDSPIKQLTND